MLIQRRREKNSTGHNRHYQILNGKMKRISSDVYYQEQNQREIIAVAMKRTKDITEYTVFLKDNKV